MISYKSRLKTNQISSRVASNKENAVIDVKKKNLAHRPALSDIGNGTGRKKAVIEVHTTKTRIVHTVPTTQIYPYRNCDLPSNVVDIDAPDYADPVFCSEYINDIYINMLNLERRFTVDPDYISTQPVLTKGMRSILIDWLADVHLRFNFHPESLYLTVDIIDRYIQTNQVTRKTLQLVGIASFYVATKFEEICLASADDLVYLTENSYNVNELLQMEAQILKALDFSLCKPTSLHFLKRISKAASADIEQHTFARYLTEVALIEYNLLKYLPSQIAAAASLLAMKVFNKPWTATLTYYSCYSEENLRPVAQIVAKSTWKSWTSKNQAIHRKFAAKKVFKNRLSQLMRTLNSITSATG